MADNICKKKKTDRRFLEPGPIRSAAVRSRFFLSEIRPRTLR